MTIFTQYIICCILKVPAFRNLKTHSVYDLKVFTSRTKTQPDSMQDWRHVRAVQADLGWGGQGVGDSFQCLKGSHQQSLSVNDLIKSLLKHSAAGDGIKSVKT